ncbi:MAG TPA: hypothetical protein VFB12_01040 [Ktedonobacteraceae bacterium]|nr:hypothetical protein [Ktedonobacteraceae bacterium]
MPGVKVRFLTQPEAVKEGSTHQEESMLNYWQPEQRAAQEREPKRVPEPLSRRAAPRRGPVPAVPAGSGLAALAPGADACAQRPRRQSAGCAVMHQLLKNFRNMLLFRGIAAMAFGVLTLVWPASDGRAP